MTMQREGVQPTMDRMRFMQRQVSRWLMSGGLAVAVALCPMVSTAAVGDEATHESDHAEDADVVELPEIHVHGVPLNKDQQQGPVPKVTPWPKVPPQLEGTVLDDWMKARFLVKKDGGVTVVVLEPARQRELTRAGLDALNRWTFDPQMQGDQAIDAELTIRIHFRSQ